MTEDAKEILANFQQINEELEALKKSDPQKYLIVCEKVAEEIEKLNNVLAKS